MVKRRKISFTELVLYVQDKVSVLYVFLFSPHSKHVRWIIISPIL